MPMAPSLVQQKSSVAHRKLLVIARDKRQTIPLLPLRIKVSNVVLERLLSNLRQQRNSPATV